MVSFLKFFEMGVWTDHTSQHLKDFIFGLCGFPWFFLAFVVFVAFFFYL
jgi:hypothetical protein